MMSATSLSIRNDLFSTSKEDKLSECLPLVNIEENTGENKYEVYYVDLPEINLNDDTPIIFSDEPVKLKEPDNENVRALFIEVPQVISEETVAYAELSNMAINFEENKDLTVQPKTENLENTDGNIPITKIIPLPEKDSPYKNRFLVQNGNNVQPFYIVKKLELLESNKNNTDDCLAPKDKTLISDQFLPRVGGKRTNDKFSDFSNHEDLMWLLNFKLDHILSDSSMPFKPLDDTPDSTSKSEQTKCKESVSDDVCHAEARRGKTQADSGVDAADVPFSMRKKPPFTYTELIECALQEKGPLTVSEIYQWISETFPYYKSWDDRWKNSVRHNLSINPYFRKGTKARQGSGHLWTVSKSAESNKTWTWKRQRYQEFEEYTKRLRTADTQVDDAKETETAVANIEDKENRGIHRDVLFATHNQPPVLDTSLEQTAEEILSGIKRNVAVEYIDTPKLDNVDGNDFLNPVPKDILMGECGFLNQIELNMTAETTDGLGLTESDHVFEIPEDLGFQYTDATAHGQHLLSLVN